MTQHVNSPAQWARASTHRHSGHTHYDMTQRVPVLHHAWPPPPALLIAAYPLLHPPHLAAIGSPDRTPRPPLLLFLPVTGKGPPLQLYPGDHKGHGASVPR
jgi:hypothetical protein